ncbi:trimeric intracellular cation channel family protein [Pedobacter changchengzhani]|uniref:Trimeric intracellular cation channel family protein n=1 Tax=Pedobacter changchengzhani TaxID=2529274 RepID=A0A4R5MIA7_9SPHI|nr:trimeric intracellular cation channel family protein [Pedobacter changchengzhani]TDG35056.1 trimeric intracellular cation channel family protein [Pedobacter changchengzhani]
MVNFNTSEVIEILGTIAFSISGTFTAMQRRLDPFGVLIIAFVTSIGGGTVRDLLIGDTPVAWMRDTQICAIILVTALIAMFFKTQVKKLRITLFLFDSLGLGFFTMLGLLKGLAFGLNPSMCIVLGTITGCFGGVIRDTLLNRIPLIFRKEIYATACILGGMLYFLLLALNVESVFAKVFAITFIFALRIVVVKYKLSLPKFNF